MSKYKIKKKRKKYALAGMYDPNQVPAGMAPGATGHIVMQETDPTLQEGREENLEAEKNKLIETSSQAANEFKNQELADKQTVQTDATNLQRRFGVGEQVLSKGLQLGFGQQAAQQGAQQAGRLFGQNAMKRAIGKGSQKAAGRIAKKQAARNVAGRAGGKAAGAASKLANPLAIAGLAASGIGMLSDDGDATKWNAGEVIGGVGGAAATGAQLGSMVLPGIGSVVGGIAGGLYGLGKGLIQRKKARTQESNLEAQRKTKIRNFNTDAADQFKSSWARAAAGRYKSKSYSGSDTGRVMPGIG